MALLDLACTHEGAASGAKSGEPIYVEGDTRHQVVVRKGGEGSEVEVAAVAGKTHDVAIAIGKGGAQATRLWPVIGVGAGLTVVAAGIGAGLLVAAKDARNEVEQKGLAVSSPCPKQPSSGPCKDIADAAGRHDALAGGAVGLFVAAGVFGAATVAYGIWPQIIPVRPAVVVAPGAAAVSISGSF